MKHKMAARVDYLTVSTDTRSTREAMAKWFDNYVAFAETKGDKGRVFRFKGYEGLAIGSVSYGERGGNAAVMFIAGAVATSALFELALEDIKVSRIDLAVTVRPSTPQPGLIASEYERVKTGEFAQNNAPVYTLITNSTGGNTLYFGSRSSQYYGRFYDKGVQQGTDEPGVALRYEVEIKKPKAKEVAHRLSACDDPSGWICAYVWDWFRARGALPIFDRSETDIAIESEFEISSPSKTLRWLSTQVKPAIERLTSAGMLKDVEDALQMQLWPMISDSTYHKE